MNLGATSNTKKIYNILVLTTIIFYKVQDP